MIEEESVSICNFDGSLDGILGISDRRQFLLTRDTTGCCILRCWLALLFYMLPCRIILYTAHLLYYNFRIEKISPVISTKSKYVFFFRSKMIFRKSLKLIGENIEDL